jgi:hypothetical protein
MATVRTLDSNHICDYENAFYWFSHPTRLNKLIAHYELYKSIAGLPGEIFELGVYKVKWTPSVGQKNDRP